ncbi:aspartate/glutamate racemase family protein [Paraneptunicella aestuarii]|uniref:aspartate/glutamate racemase family protein n=1 Tax=Paraneptunicella aestuarii TaxID=2831148 RepID=UPI001E60B42A|nr:aspartate/glutamate racemase family protein [Paraneptunicella aestuarii]UAA39606.1 aspartate/glutamate racemase family protein [Paraneptunicella aestuarii]
MKLIGLLGGMSWESSAVYYQAINEGIKQRLGGLHSAELLMYSIDFARLEKMQREGDWQTAAQLLIEKAKRIEGAGAQCLLICTNTMHIVAEQVANAISIPLIHIADAVGEKLVKANVDKVALLGTSFTMTEAFYRVRLQENFGLNVITPKADDRKLIHDVIYNELCLGKIQPESKQAYLDIIAKLKEQGAEAVILGCTEIGLLIQQDDCPLPLYDTVMIHAKKAVEFALQE